MSFATYASTAIELKLEPDYAAQSVVPVAGANRESSDLHLDLDLNQHEDLRLLDKMKRETDTTGENVNTGDGSDPVGTATALNLFPPQIVYPILESVKIEEPTNTDDNIEVDPLEITQALEDDVTFINLEVYLQPNADASTTTRSLRPRKRKSPVKNSDTEESDSNSDPVAQNRSAKKVKHAAKPQQQTPTSTGPDILCTHCDKKLRSEIKLKYHLGRDHGIPVWKCEIEDCPKMFKKRSEVRSHKFTHIKTKDCICTTCGKTLSSPMYLKAHNEVVHSEVARGEERSFQCDLCERKFKFKIKLVCHTKNVHGPKKFVCGICGRGFKVKGALHKHGMTHDPVKGFKCAVPDCKGEFSTADGLRHHMNFTHGNSKKFLCEKCGYKCGTPGALAHHELSHTKEKSELCPICGKYYTTVSINTHINKMHSKTWGSFACEHCERTFKKKEDFEMHVKPHQSNKHHKGECWKWYAEREGRVVVRKRKPHKKLANRNTTKVKNVSKKKISKNTKEDSSSSSSDQEGED